MHLERVTPANVDEACRLRVRPERFYLRLGFRRTGKLTAAGSPASWT
jgi:hypothetical protein